AEFIPAPELPLHPAEAPEVSVDVGAGVESGQAPSVGAPAGDSSDLDGPTVYGPEGHEFDGHDGRPSRAPSIDLGARGEAQGNASNASPSLDIGEPRHGKPSLSGPSPVAADEGRSSRRPRRRRPFAAAFAIVTLLC